MAARKVLTIRCKWGEENEIFLLKVDAEKNWYELDDDNYANRQIALDEFNEFIFHA